ncbi:hypothetical protein NPIL_520911, partial [Nephila pilipes]
MRYTGHSLILFITFEAFVIYIRGAILPSIENNSSKKGYIIECNCGKNGTCILYTDGLIRCLCDPDILIIHENGAQSCR